MKDNTWSGSAWLQPSFPFSAKYVFTFGNPGYLQIIWAVKSNGDIYNLGTSGWQLTRGSGGSFGMTDIGYPLCIDTAANAAYRYDDGTRNPYQSARTGKTMKQLTVGYAITTDGEIWSTWFSVP